MDLGPERGIDLSDRAAATPITATPQTRRPISNLALAGGITVVTTAAGCGNRLAKSYVGNRRVELGLETHGNYNETTAKIASELPAFYYPADAYFHGALPGFIIGLALGAAAIGLRNLYRRMRG